MQSKEMGMQMFTAYASHTFLGSADVSGNEMWKVGREFRLKWLCRLKCGKRNCLTFDIKSSKSKATCRHSINQSNEGSDEVERNQSINQSINQSTEPYIFMSPLEECRRNDIHSNQSLWYFSNDSSLFASISLKFQFPHWKKISASWVSSTFASFISSFHTSNK